MGKPKQTLTTLECCDRASALLKEAGFVLENQSMRTEACYYRWPDRVDLIRIATHKSKRSMIGLGNVVSRITFNGNRNDQPGEIRICDEAIENRVMWAIGKYFLKSESTCGLIGLGREDD